MEINIIHIIISYLLILEYLLLRKIKRQDNLYILGYGNSYAGGYGGSYGGYGSSYGGYGSPYGGGYESSLTQAAAANLGIGYTHLFG